MPPTFDPSLSLSLQGAEANFRQKEASYYASMAAKDPAVVMAKPVPSGIQQRPPPGYHPPGQFGLGYYTNWNARYAYITGDLQQSIRGPPPPDYTWTPVGELQANAGVGKLSPPQIVHATPSAEQAELIMSAVSAAGAPPISPLRN